LAANADLKKHQYFLTSGRIAQAPNTQAKTSTMKPALKLANRWISHPIARGEHAPTRFPTPFKTPTPDAAARAGMICAESANRVGRHTPSYPH
jgi:hypothetical protein